MNQQLNENNTTNKESIIYISKNKKQIAKISNIASFYKLLFLMIILSIIIITLYVIVLLLNMIHNIF